MNKNARIVVGLIVVVLIIMGVASGIKNAPTRTLSYENKANGATFEYPANFKVEERKLDTDVKAGVILTSGKDRIAMSITPEAPMEAEIERQFFTASLKAQPKGDLRTAEIEFGGFHGIKNLIDFTSSQYFLYKQAEGTTTVIALQIETNSKDSNTLLELENTLRSILSTMTLK